MRSSRAYEDIKPFVARDAAGAAGRFPSLRYGSPSTQTLFVIRHPPFMRDDRRFHSTLATSIAVILGALSFGAMGASSSSLSATELRAIYKAVGLKEHAGELLDACNQVTQPEHETVDLNSDGQPEVFVTVPGSCQGGAVGAELSLLIRSTKGHWKLNLGFPAGGYKLLSTTRKGFPDIEIHGPGSCFSIWRWNGNQYGIHKRCDR